MAVQTAFMTRPGFPPRYAGASLKQDGHARVVEEYRVFPRVMREPH